jgi:hypothetical protein
VPVWLRLSLMDEEKNRTWMERVEGQSGLKQFFTVQEDLSIWPDDLAPDDSV